MPFAVTFQRNVLGTKKLVEIGMEVMAEWIYIFGWSFKVSVCNLQTDIYLSFIALTNISHNTILAITDQLRL